MFSWISCFISFQRDTVIQLSGCTYIYFFSQKLLVYFQASAVMLNGGGFCMDISFQPRSVMAQLIIRQCSAF